MGDSVVKLLILLGLMFFILELRAQDESTVPMMDLGQEELAIAVDREPSSEALPSPEKVTTDKKNSEQELKVQTQLPNAIVKRDARTIQNEVYRTIYRRDLKVDQREDTLDE
jgi:hypothetical protein